MRKCNKCEFSFESVVEGTWEKMAEELRVMSDHLTVHNPSPAQWSDAYERIQKAKEGKKKE